jgi:hypothetical protein
MTAQAPAGLAESLFQVWVVFTILGMDVAMSVWIIDRDMRRLPPAMLERAYSVTSFAAAIFAGSQFGLAVIAVFVHFVRTRRSFKGVLLGLFWLVVARLPVVVFLNVLLAVRPEWMRGITPDS